MGRGQEETVGLGYGGIPLFAILSENSDGRGGNNCGVLVVDWMSKK